MPQSVEEDGAVRGPAPRGFSNVAIFCPKRDILRLRREAEGSGIVIKSAPLLATSDPSEKVGPLEIDTERSLRAEISAVKVLLIDTESSQQQSEKRMERACTSLLIDGERIPSLEQADLSAMQEAYLNASTATIIGAEKIIILEAQINRLELRLREITDCHSTAQITHLSRAA